jgi:hypothetical protein
MLFRLPSPPQSGQRTTRCLHKQVLPKMGLLQTMQRMIISAWVFLALCGST